MLCILWLLCWFGFSEAERRCLSESDVNITLEKFIPLNQYPVSTQYDLGILGIKVITLLKRTHSEGFAPKSLCIHSFLISEAFGYITLCSVTTVAKNELKISNLRQAVDVLRSIASNSDIEHPNELNIVELLVNKAIELDYDEFIRILSRLTLSGTVPPLVQQFYKLLSVEELVLLQAQVPDTCLKSTISIVGSNMRFLKSDPSGHGSCMQYSGVTVTGRSITIKRCDDLTVVRESSVISLLQAIPQVVRRHILRDRRHECRASVLVTGSPWWRIPLSSLGDQSVEWISEFAVAGLKFLQAVHEEGFNHGRIGEEAFLFNRFSRSLSSMSVGNWDNAQPWNTSVPTHRYSSEDPRALSVFELDTGHPSRRDDLYRFCEILLKLLRHPDFHNSIPEESVQMISALKKRRMLDPMNPVPACFVILYTIVTNLDEQEDPDYSYLIGCFRDVETVRVYGVLVIRYSIFDTE